MTHVFDSGVGRVAKGDRFTLLGLQDANRKNGYMKNEGSPACRKSVAPENAATHL